MKRRTIVKFVLINLLFISFVCICYSKVNAEDWLKKGKKASDYQEKIRCFIKAIENNPKSAEAYFNLGCAYRDIGELNKAENAFNRALRYSPDNIDNSTKLKRIYELGKTYSKLGKHEYAKESFICAKNIALDLEIKSDIFYELGKAYLLLEEFDQAIVYLNEGIKLNPKNPASFKTAIEHAKRLKQLNWDYEKGVTYFEKGNYTEAVNLFSKVVKEDANFKDIADKLYQSQIRLAQKKEEQTLYAKKEEQSLSVNNNNEEQSLNVDKKNDKPRSKKINPPKSTPKVIKKSANNYPREEKIGEHYQRGLSALRKDDWRGAIYNFLKVKKMNPNYRDINSRLMEARLGMESAKEMEEVAKFYNHALTEFNEGKWLKAIIYFEKAKMLYPGYKDIELKIVEAKKHLKKINNGKNTNSFKEVNNKNYKKNNWTVAGLICSAILLPLAIFVLSSPAIRARYYLLKGQYNRASQLYEHILSKHPEKTKIYISLANIYLVNNRNDEMALKVYHAALQNKINPSMKEKIISIVANEYLKKNVIDDNSVDLLTHALQSEMKKLG